MKHGFWGQALLRALPGIALGVAAGALGLDEPLELALAFAGALYLCADLLIFARRARSRSDGDVPAATAAETFLQRALELPSASAVAVELSRATAEALASPRIYLMVPGEDGALLVLDGDGHQPELDLGDPAPAFAWLESFAQPIFRTTIDVGAGDGSAATAQLLATVGCEVVLPLRHRGLLLGLALIGAAAQTDAPFLRAMRAYATVAVANTFLGQETTSHRRLTRAFDLASAAQASILPDERPIIRPEFELRGLCRPAAECGGDLWAWHELPGGRVLVIIADATGHGAAPALLAAVAKGAACASWALFGDQDAVSPGEVLATIGRAVGRTARRRYFMTAFCAILDVRSGELAYANAGQNFPYVVTGGKLAPLVARGNWLGDDPALSPVVHSRTLAPGDKLILFTDGAVDAGAPAAAPFGDKQFRAAVRELSGERAVRIPGALLERIERHLGANELSDDITLVAIELSQGAGAA